MTMLRKATPERLSTFSDGVFAVLITVLVLDLRPPQLPTFKALLLVWPTWLSYAVSYLFIAIVWTNHHYLLRYAGEATLLVTADMRYRGQSYEIETPLEQSWIAAGDHAAIAAAFHKRHAEIYDHSDDAADVQIVALRVVIAGVTPKPEFAEQGLKLQQTQPRKRIPIVHQGSTIEAGLFNRSDMSPGSFFAGPAVILQDDTTTWAPPGFEGHVDGFGNLILKRSAI